MTERICYFPKKSFLNKYKLKYYINFLLIRRPYSELRPRDRDYSLASFRFPGKPISSNQEQLGPISSPRTHGLPPRGGQQIMCSGLGGREDNVWLTSRHIYGLESGARPCQVQWLVIGARWTSSVSQGKLRTRGMSDDKRHLSWL